MSTPLEIERKYVIRKPNVAMLSSLEGYTVSDIEQTYLESAAHVTHRVRARSYGECTVYTETKKVRIDKMSVYEDEREIDEAEYERLLTEIKPGSRTVRKTRRVVLVGSVNFEIDEYPEWCRTCIMETELNSRDELVVMPPFLKVIAEVTGVKRYTNASMSREFPDELI